MLFRLAVCVALLSVGTAEIKCVTCNKARGTEEDCNTQSGGNSETCDDDEVCTIDVRCDGKDRPTWIKGCEKAKGITALDEILCKDNLRRCNIHCDSADFCNQNAPDGFVERLACTPNITTTTSPPQLVTDLPCECLVRGDPYVKTSDNELVLITDAQLTLLSEWQFDITDPCKFSLVIKTVESGGEIIIDSVSFSFGVPADPNQFAATLNIGCNVMVVDQVGQGSQALVPGFEFDDGQTHVIVTEGNGKVMVRSDTCAFELDFYCDGGDGKPYVRFAVGEQYVPGEHLRGMCADCDNVMDDMRDCFTLEDLSDIEPIEDKYTAISQSCAVDEEP